MWTVTTRQQNSQESSWQSPTLHHHATKLHTLQLHTHTHPFNTFPPNQQHQSTEGLSHITTSIWEMKIPCEYPTMSKANPVKIEWWSVGVVICLERLFAFCLHTVQLMPLHPRIPLSLASFKSRLVLPFWHRLTQVVQEKRLLNGCSSSIIQCQKQPAHLDDIFDSRGETA